MLEQPVEQFMVKYMFARHNTTLTAPIYYLMSGVQHLFLMIFLVLFYARLKLNININSSVKLRGTVRKC